MNVHSMQTYVAAMLNALIVWTAMIVDAAADFIGADRNAIRKMVRLKQPKKRRRRPENQIILVYRPIIGYAISAPNSLIVTMAFADAEMDGPVMASNASTIVPTIPFGKMIDVLLQVMKMNRVSHVWNSNTHQMRT